MNKPIIIIAGLLLLFNAVHGQNSAPDSSESLQAKKAAVNFFNTAIKEQSRLYNGAEYREYPINIKNNPYFGDNTAWQKNSLTYDGYKFDDVYINYDINRDELVALLYDKTIKCVLFAPRVGRFDISGHHFFYISADTVNHGPGSGFYDLLYNGNIRALARYSKTIQNSSNSSDFQTYFTDVKTYYYIQKGPFITQVSNQGELLKLLQDRKKELQGYIKANNIRYKKQPQQALAAIVSYYDHLKN